MTAPDIRYQSPSIEHYFAAQYKQKGGRRLGLATEGTKIIRLVVIGRPIRVLKVRGKERGYISNHATTVQSWVDYLTEAGPRLGITKEAEAMIQAARLQLKEAKDGKHATSEDAEPVPQKKGTDRVNG